MGNPEAIRKVVILQKEDSNMTAYVMTCYNGHTKVEVNGTTYDFDSNVTVSEEFLCKFFNVDNVRIVNEW